MSTGVPRRHRAADLALAVTFLVATVGALLIVISLLADTRASVPALGLVLVVVGVMLGWQFGIRPALRQKRSPVLATASGLRALGAWSVRMVSGRR